MFLVVTFPSSHAALRAERELLDAGVPVELIPVPRRIRGDCGFCLLADAGEEGSAEAGRRLGRLAACGGRDRWRVVEAPADPAQPGSRKEKSYERFP